MSEGHQPHAVPASAIHSNQPKSTILKKSNTKAKKGLGARKTGGLGAHKVKKIDFSELEKNAEEADKARTRLSISSSGSDKKTEEKMTETSMRLAYQDIETIKQQNEKKMSRMDDKRKEQAVRLGMGMGKVDGVSHSMKIMTIDQQSPQNDHPRRNRYDDEDKFYDARSNKDRWMNDDDSDDDDGNWGKRDFSYKQTFTNREPKGRSSKSDQPPTYTIKPIEDTHKNVSSVIISSSSVKQDESSRQRKNQSTTDRFAGAKAISSSMMYDESANAEYEREQRIRSLEGRTAISSEDYYGSGNKSSSSSYSASSQLPDLGNLKDGVRSVAGKMSSMMSGIASTIQDRYGT